MTKQNTYPPQVTQDLNYANLNFHKFEMHMKNLLPDNGLLTGWSICEYISWSLPLHIINVNYFNINTLPWKCIWQFCFRHM